jgi:hypothetical protein
MKPFEHWRRIDYSVLARYLASPQLNALVNYDDTITNDKVAIDKIIQDVVARVRSELVYLTSLPEDPYLIPDAFISSTCYLIIESLFSRIPSLRLSPDQVRNAEKARDHIRNLVQMQMKTAGITKTSQNIYRPAISLVGKSREKRFHGNALEGF